MKDYYVQRDPGSSHRMELWVVTTEENLTLYVETNGNGGFGPVNVWDGERWHAVKFRSRVNG